MRKTTTSVYRKINQWRMGFMALCMLFACLPAMSQTLGTVPIGSGTATTTALPVYTYYFYTYSQQIVKATDFTNGGGAAGQITAIRYYVGTAEVPLANWENWTVYLGHTAKTTFTSTTNWEPIANLTQVFTGTVTPVAGGWMEIVLDTPFTYDGTSNLIVAVDENSPGYSDSFTSSYWGAYAGGANTGLYYSSDTVNPDPAGTLPAGVRVANLPRLQFNATLASCLPPSNVHASTVGSTTATIEWTAPQVAPSDGYEYYVSTTNTAPTVAGTAAATATASIASLAPNTLHYVWVRSKCGTTFTSWIAGTSFTTACAAVAAPLTQEFSTGLIPSCWTTTSSNPVANGLWKFAGAVDYDPGNTRPVGTFAWADGSDPSNIADVTLLTPYIDLTGITNPEVVFDYFSNNLNTQPNNIFSVDVFNGTEWTNIYQDDTSDENWRTITLPLTAYANTTIRLRFVVDKTAAASGFAFYNDIALDNVKVRQVPSCIVPTELLVTADSPTTLGLSWTPPSPAPASGYEYYHSTSSTAPLPTAEGTDVPTGTIATISSLTPATTYYVWVRSVCSGTSVSEWTPSGTATTLCVPADVPYIENFESVTTPALPTCTSVINEGLGSTWITATPAAGGFTSKALRYNYSFTGAGDTWFFTRAVNLTAGTSYRISYRYGASSTFYTEKLRVGYGMIAESASMEELADYPTVTGVTPTSAFVDFTPTTTGVYYFGFQAYSASGQNYLYVDDIAVNLSPTCLAPTELLVDDATLNTATVSWTASESTPSAGYEIYHSTTNTAPTATTVAQTTVGAGVLTATVQSLTSSSVYYIWVRANCGNGDFSEWTPAVIATTLCEPANVPYTENFESATVPALPVCTSVVNEGTGNAWATAAAPGGGFTTKALRYGYNTANAADTWFFTRGVNLTAGTSYRISYKYGATSATWTEKLSVGYGTLAEAAAMEELVAYETVINITPASAFVDFTPTTTGVHYIGFHAYSNANQNVLLVDDISVDLSPTCLAPTGVMVDGTTVNSATISWTASTSAPSAGYQYYYSTTNTAPVAVTTPSGSVGAGVVTATIPGLASSSTYYVWVRANCGNSDFSAWTPGVTFATPCVAIVPPATEEFSTGVKPNCWTTTSSNPVANGLWKFAGAVDYDPGNTRPLGTFAWADGSDPSTIADVTLLSPNYDLTGINNPEVVFDYFSNNLEQYPNNTFTVDVYNGTVWTNIYTNNTSDPNWRTITLPLTAYAGMTIQLRFVVDKTAAPLGYAFYNDIALDNVKVRQVPSCIVPTALAATPSGTTTVDLAWTAPTAVPSNGYQYYYNTTGTSPLAGTPGSADVPTGTSVTVPGLTSATTYYFWVRSFCGGDSYSEWSLSASATTLCDAANVPYTVDFESATVPALPVCSVVVNEGSGNVWTTAAAPGGGFTTKALRYGYNLTNDADTWFFTRGVNLVAGTTYKLSYKYGATSATWTESFSVGYGTVAASGSMTQLANHPAVSGVTPTNAFVNFTPPTSGVYYFGFHANSVSNQNVLLIDDIVVDAAAGTGDISLGSFRHYPNPVKDVLNISNTSDITSVAVYNLLGQQVLAKEVNATETVLDMTALADGAYIVNVTAGSSVKTIKVIKKQ